MLYTLFKNIIMKNVFYFLIILLTITSCKKKCEEPIKEKPTFECSEIPPYDKVGFGYEYLVDNNSQKLPYFNPNDGNEFVYLTKNPSTGLSNIYTYNLLTKTKKLLYDGQVNSYVKWTTADWILFSNGSLQKMKINNSILIEITELDDLFTLRDRNNEVMYLKKNSSTIDYEFYFSDLNNIIFDSLFALNSGFIDWGANNKIIFSDDISKIVYDLSTKTSQTYCENYGNPISNSKWINDFEFIWADENYIFKTNININKTDTISTHCNGFLYQSFDYSPQTDKLICHRLTKKLLENDVVKVDIYIVMMNTDGTEKEIIDLDRVCE